MNEPTGGSPGPLLRICFIGQANLGALAPQFAELRAGGAERQQVLLARTLARRGAQVSMIVADHGQPDGWDCDGIRIFRTCRPRAGLPVLRFLHPRWTSLWGAMARADADVYYLSCAGAQLGQAVLYARRHRRRVVFRIASQSDCDPDTLLVRHARDRWLYAWGLKHADLVLAQTLEQQRLLRVRFGRDSHVIPSLTEAPAGRLPAERRDVDVLWVGNLRELKRPDRLLAAARALPHLRFEMVGGVMPGAQALYARVASLAKALPNVEFHGALPASETAALYARARVLAGTSEIEGFPSSYLQAWGCGTPVVSFLDPDGVIQRERLGRIVADVPALCAALGALAQGGPEWEYFSARALAWAQAQASADPVRQFLEALGGPVPSPAAPGPAPQTRSDLSCQRSSAG